MPQTQTYRSVVEADSEGLFIRLPDGWKFEPEDSDVMITRVAASGKYRVEPIIGNDGQPNCKFIFPEADAG